MPIFDNPGKAMRHIEQELLDAASEEAGEGEAESGLEAPPVNYAVDFDRTAYADEETDERDVCYAPDSRKTPKKKGAGTLLLALAELALLAAGIWWWIRWRS